MTTVVSWHVQKFVLFWNPIIELHKIPIFHWIWTMMEKFFMKCAPVLEIVNKQSFDWTADWPAKLLVLHIVTMIRYDISYHIRDTIIRYVSWYYLSSVCHKLLLTLAWGKSPTRWENGSKVVWNQISIDKNISFNARLFLRARTMCTTLHSCPKLIILGVKWYDTIYRFHTFWQTGNRIVTFLLVMRYTAYRYAALKITPFTWQSWNKWIHQAN